MRDAIAKPPLTATPTQLWRAFKATAPERVHGNGGEPLADLVHLVRSALLPNFTLVPYRDALRERYNDWLQARDAGNAFTEEQRAWLDHIAEHIGSSLTIEPRDFESGWFGQQGSLGKAHALFGDQLKPLLAELNERLAACAQEARRNVAEAQQAAAGGVEREAGGVSASLPQGWALRPLPEIAQINPPLDSSVSCDDTPVTFVPMRAVGVEGSGLVAPETRPYGEVKRGFTAFRPGDVIMAKITPCMENGKTTLVPEVPSGVCFGSTEFHVIRPEAGINGKWIEQFLLQHETRRDAQREMGGAVGQMRVPAAFLQSLRVPVPPQAEQDRIARFVDETALDMDAGITALQRCQEKLARYHASVLKAAVEGDLTADWRKRHPDVAPASKLLQRILAERRRRWEQEQQHAYAEKGKPLPKNWKAKYKEPAAPPVDGLSSLPRGWCWATLDHLAWTSGYGISVKCKADNAGLAVLRIPNVVDGALDLTDLKFAPADYAEHPGRLIAAGDMLIVRTNGSLNLIGRAAIVKNTPPAALSFASYLIRFRLISAVEWMSVLWDSHLVRQWVSENCATSAG